MSDCRGRIRIKNSYSLDRSIHAEAGRQSAFEDGSRRKGEIRLTFFDDGTLEQPFGPNARHRVLPVGTVAGPARQGGKRGVMRMKGRATSRTVRRTGAGCFGCVVSSPQQHARLASRARCSASTASERPALHAKQRMHRCDNPDRYPYFDKHEGGEEEIASLLYNVKGLCQDRDFPSYDGYTHFSAYLTRLRVWSRLLPPARYSRISLAGTLSEPRHSARPRHERISGNSACSRRVPEQLSLIKARWRS